MLFISFSSGNGHCITLHFYAHKEKLLKEFLYIGAKDTEKTVKLVLHARVLGR